MLDTYQTTNKATMLSENNSLMTMTIEEMIKTGQLRFKKNGKVDGRCVAMKNEIVDENGNDLRVLRKSAKEEKEHEQQEPVAVEATTPEKEDKQQKDEQKEAWITTK